MNEFHRPNWVPQLRAGARVLVVGATGGIGQALTQVLRGSPSCTIGAHGRRAVEQVAGIVALQAELESAQDCEKLVSDFVAVAGGIDGLVVLSGGIAQARHWLELDADAWEADIATNLNHPFFLARSAFCHMRAQGSGGRIVLNGTESALHGGGAQSLAYGVAKRATECLVQGLAREGASDGILVNGVRFGFVASGFHERWQQKSAQDLTERAKMVPLGRAGHPDEAAALIAYLLSDWAGYITGQMFPLTGGDWL